MKLYGWGLPHDISTHGAAIDRLINLMHVFMFVIFIGWGLFFLYCLWRFRARPGHKASYELKPFGFTKWVELGILGVELLLLFALATPIVSQAKTPPSESESFNVRVVAQQFAWNIHYPGPDGRFGRTAPELVTEDNLIGLDRKQDPAAKDDVVTNELRVPTHRKILVKLSSKDVIHSFFLPVARVKHDAIPGMSVPVWFEVKEEGEFEIACAQLCGNAHYRMRNPFVVTSQAKFDVWMAEQQKELAEAAQ